jgi:hypothetical protein
MKNSGTAQRDSRPPIIDASPPSVAVWMHTTAMKANQRNRSMPACRDLSRGGEGASEDGATAVKRGRQAMVGMTNELSACSSSLSGQRAVTVLVLVQNRRPSMPCWLMSPKAERFQPPKL